MEKINFPKDYQQVMPYLIIKDAQGFLNFTKDVFEAKELQKHMRDEHIIMHGEIAIGASVIMFADATDAFSTRPAGMFVYVADADATYEKAIAAGATAITPVSNQPYGRSGGVLDPYGNQWWITTNV